MRAFADPNLLPVAPGAAALPGVVVFVARHMADDAENRDVVCFQPDANGVVRKSEQKIRGAADQENLSKRQQLQQQ